jgi:EamA domain-containing membrane protein RarD
VPGEKSARRRGVLLILIATVLWSMAGLFARLLAHLDIWTVMGWRALLGAASIALVSLIEYLSGASTLLSVSAGYRWSSRFWR